MALAQRKNRGAGSPWRPARNAIVLPSPKNLRVALGTRKDMVVTVALSMLLLWIYALGGFSFSKFETQTRYARSRALTQTLIVLEASTQRQILAFAIHIVPGGPTQRHNVTGNILFTTAGPHSVQVSLLGQSDPTLFPNNNPQPPILRLMGDVLIPIPLIIMTQSATSKNQNQWTGTFFLPPMDGHVQLESQWAGKECATAAAGDKGKTPSCSMKLSKQINLNFILGVGDSATRLSLDRTPTTVDKKPTWTDIETLFPPIAEQFWIHVDRLERYPRTLAETMSTDPKNGMQQPPQQKYVWGDFAKLNKYAKWTAADSRQLTNETPAYVALSSTVLPFNQPWFDSFDQLSNYEIVCWMGGRSAELIQAAFMSLRADLFPRQRPFKFHYHPMASLEQPDITWDDDLKWKFRKCKHVFISLEDVVFMETSIGDALSALEFQQRVATFTQHLINAFPDASFPIYMVLTHLMMETPLQAQYETHHCYGGNNNNITATTDNPLHSLENPCHVVLRQMFTQPQKAKLFPAADQDRIRLLDNTPISQALIGNNVGTMGHPRPLDVLGIVGLRLYVLLGKQVKQWRDGGQVGAIDGLHRNDTIVWTEENLRAYEWK
jgi:hypothetical protein